MAHIDIGQDSVLNLYSDVEITDGLQVAFSSAAQQYNYFNGRLVKQYTGMSYVYRNGVVKIQDTPQVVAKANYISFNNPSFESKPIYARIVDYQYVNNATVKIAYAVDWFQTFMFDVDYRFCQILREHLSETDWAKATANPWAHDILELETPENFSFSEEDRPHINTTSGTNYMQVPDDSTTCYVIAALSPFSFDIAKDPEIDTHTPERDMYNWLQGFKFTSIKDALANDNFEQIAVSTVSEYASNDGLPEPINLYIFSIDSVYASLFDLNAEWKRGEGSRKTRLAGLLDDLTAMSRTSQLVSLYYAPKAVVRAFLGGSDTTKNVASVTDLASRCTQGSNPKLKRFPFSYLTVETPSGVRKEYHYERFNNPASQLTFYLLGSYNTTPFLSLVPFNYGYGNPSAVNMGKDGYNLAERVDYMEIPQLGYTLDGFLTFMSSYYQQAQQNMSTPTQLARMGEFLGGAATVVGSLAPTLAGGLMPSSMPIDSSALSRGISNAMGNAAMGQDSKVGAAAGAAAMGHAISSQYSDLNVREVMGRDTPLGSPIYDYSAEKSLYDNDIYHPGAAGGYPAYKLARFYFQFYFRTITPAWAEIADNFFNAFGYNSGRIGIPRICNFMSGSGDQPHFVTYDGAPSTYVKTTDAHVISNLKPASDYIEALFNAGCRFINGNGR